jgi:hypothetical protein
MYTLDKTAWEVLNATADDSENLEQIYRQICFERTPDSPQSDHPDAYFFHPVPNAPFLHEIADRIRELVGAGLLTAVSDEEGRPFKAPADLSYIWRAWFRMTPEGERAWESSPLGNSVEQE